MRYSFVLAGVFLGLIATTVVAQPQPMFNVISEETSEQRRSLAVRLDQRLDEATLMKIATDLKARSKREVVKTQVGFFLPGMPVNQGSWANVLFSPEPKLIVSGLRLEDEELLQAEFKADTRSLLGSWLTSPPAPAGRLTIYSDHGRIFAEWRLRSGMKSVEELREASVGKVRRFEMAGGGSYVLTKSGDIEIWDQTTLISVGERMRHDAPVAAGLVAARAAPAPARAGLVSDRVAPSVAARSALGGAVEPAALPLKPASPVISKPVIAAGASALPAPPVGAPAAVGPAPPKPAVAQVSEVPAEPVVAAKAVKKASRKAPETAPQIRSKPRVVQTERAVGQPRTIAQGTSKGRGPITTGDRISAQLTGGF